MEQKESEINSRRRHFCSTDQFKPTTVQLDHHDLDIDSLLKELRQKTLPNSSDLELRSKGEGIGQ